MKKTKLIYIFLFITLLFSFNTEVNAIVPSNYNWPQKGGYDKSCSKVTEEFKTEFESGNVLFNADEYKTNCVYTYTEKTLGEKTCIILQYAYTTNEKFRFEQISKEGASGVNQNFTIGDNYYRNKISFQYPLTETITYDGAEEDSKNILKSLSELNGLCASPVLYDYGEMFGEEQFDIPDSSGITSYNEKKKMTRVYNRTPELDVSPLLTPIRDNQNVPCEDILGEELVNVIQKIYNLLKIGIPLVLFVLGSIDMIQAVFSGSEDNMKKAQGKLMKRVIISVAIFLIPTLLGVILRIGYDIWPEVIDKSLCGINL